MISSLDESILVHTAFPLSINVFDYVFLSIYLKLDSRKLGSRKLGENKVDVFKKGRELTLTNLTPPLQILLIAKVSFWQMSNHYRHLIKIWWAFLLGKICWNFCFLIYKIYTMKLSQRTLYTKYFWNIKAWTWNLKNDVIMR